MELVVELLVTYLLNMAAGLHSGKILEKEEQAFKERLRKEAEATQEVRERIPLKDQLRLVGTEAARKTGADGLSPAAKPMITLLTDELFQEAIARWLTAWNPKERKEAEAALAGQMIKELRRAGVEERYLEEFTARYFDRIEKTVFSDPVLANWRLNLALQALFERLEELDTVIRKEGLQARHETWEQHQTVMQAIKEIATQLAVLQTGQFTLAQREWVEKRYRELALEFCDIMDMHNLPESDRHIATRQQELKLRRLYVPLRVRVEITADRVPGEQDLEEIENRRDDWQALRLEGRGKRIIDADDEDEEEAGDSDKNRVPVGKRLSAVKRLVLLGDPGAGKTTLLRWIATAYLLRFKEDPAWKDLPDVASLPANDWLPVVVRCRDLGESCKTGSIYDVLCETFKKYHLSGDESGALQAVIIEKLVEGKAILLVDGLDEIANPGVRAGFCQQIERMQAAFPLAPMIVTSRIVGYREMNYRIGRGFEHAVVAGFSKKDKDEFARRWCEITELPERRDSALQELIRAIHGTDRIERLAENPMLLTTLALVKRKVGKLPKRRADLYWEAVLVLLNWRSEVDEPIDHREAVPQLQYVAYHMCRQGVQRLREEEILELLERMREEYPHLRALKKHDPQEFLRLLERRTGILVEVGEVRHLGRPCSVFEFRHLTFQEYLAALALVEGKYPGRDKSETLGQHIAPLAGETEEFEGECALKTEAIVKGNWREVLRLCVACCGDDQVDEVLLAILNPLPGEDTAKTARPRAVLAVSCLADEPNLSDQTAQQIIQSFVQQVKKGDGNGRVNTIADSAAMELVGLEWETPMRAALIREFCRRDPLERWNSGSLCGIMGLASAPEEENEFNSWLLDQVARLKSNNEAEAIEAALNLLIMVYTNRGEAVNGMVESLMALLDKNGPAAFAGVWVLGWLSKSKKWAAKPNETGKLISFVSNPGSDRAAVLWAIDCIKNTRDRGSVKLLIEVMADGNKKLELRRAAIKALGKIGDHRAVEPLLHLMVNEHSDVPRAALAALAKINEDETEMKLLTRFFDGNYSWLDPKEPVEEERIKEAAENLRIPEPEIRQRYERLAKKYQLKLGW